MANSYARVKRSIWGDDDFRELPMPSQWLYFHLLTSPSLSHAGVTDWRPSRIASLARGQTADAVEAASVDLEGNLYILVDRDTEEAMIRTFIRHDGLMAQPNMAAAMVKAHAGISSKVIRGVIVHEMKRLRKDEPDLNGWNRPEVKTILRRVAITPADAFAQLPRYGFNPSGKGPLTPSGKGSLKGSGKGCPTPSPYSLLLTPTPSPHHGSPESSPHQGDGDANIGDFDRRESSDG